jgi:cytochrome bd-type quinol oxidase subunit 2
VKLAEVQIVMKFDSETFHTADDVRPVAPRRNEDRGRTAVWQSRLVMLVMINLAQLWILSAAIEAALARHFSQLWPLIIASAVCWAIALTIFLWWKPAAKRSRAASRIARK